MLKFTFSRMDLQHFGILLLLNENLLLAPISQKQGPNKILDQGTGTGKYMNLGIEYLLLLISNEGIWAIEIGEYCTYGIVEIH